MSEFRTFKGQYYGQPIFKHENLPLYMVDQFNFYRCLEFKDKYYEKTVSILFNGNLRHCTGRYSSLFGNQKLSYWADSPKTARAEIKKHGAGCNILTFWAYDDGTSTFPTLENQKPLIIIDGRRCGIQELIDKVDKGIVLSTKEQTMLESILKCDPDCIAFDSHARNGGENYLFFEKGFSKLALRELRLRFGKTEGGAHNKIVCATTSDYRPVLEEYGSLFVSKAKIGFDENYLLSDEYKQRKRILEESLKRFQLGGKQ